MDIIEDEFKDRAIIRGKTPRYEYIDALAVMNRCKELNRKILGIDAEHRTQPVMEHSIDYSLPTSPKGSDDGNWSDAIKFMRDKANKGFVFEIVYEN